MFCLAFGLFTGGLSVWVTFALVVAVTFRGVKYHDLMSMVGAPAYLLVTTAIHALMSGTGTWATSHDYQLGAGLVLWGSAACFALLPVFVRQGVATPMWVWRRWWLPCVGNVGNSQMVHLGLLTSGAVAFTAGVLIVNAPTNGISTFILVAVAALVTGVMPRCRHGGVTALTWLSLPPFTYFAVAAMADGDHKEGDWASLGVAATGLSLACIAAVLARTRYVGFTSPASPTATAGALQRRSSVASHSSSGHRHPTPVHVDVQPAGSRHNTSSDEAVHTPAADNAVPACDVRVPMPSLPRSTPPSTPLPEIDGDVSLDAAWGSEGAACVAVVRAIAPDGLALWSLFGTCRCRKLVVGVTAHRFLLPRMSAQPWPPPLRWHPHGSVFYFPEWYWRSKAACSSGALVTPSRSLCRLPRGLLRTPPSSRLTTPWLLWQPWS